MKTSKVEFITGCMKSGKSLELIKRILEHDHDLRYLIIKPGIDSRDGAKVVSRGCEETFDAVMVDENNTQIINLLFSNIETYYKVFIDESQFFSEKFMRMLLDYCYTHDVDVVASGLSFDFKGNFFPSSDYLLDTADKYTPLDGVCDMCNSLGNIDILLDTHIRKKIIDGDSILVDGSSDRFRYLTVCPSCNTELEK